MILTRNLLMLTAVISVSLYGAGTVEISGVVKSSPGGAPLQFAEVRIFNLEKTVTTDATGQFRFADLPSGDFLIVASKEGFVAVTAHVSADKDTHIDFELPSSPVRHDTVVVTGTGEPAPVSALTHSTGVVEEYEIEATRQVGFDELLNRIPGVKASSQNNTQEVRISIRGRGERGTFGDRGVKILVDGIPETDASGETSDFVGLDLGTIERIEVAKGPMSAQYGASSSGVVQALSRRGGPEPDFEYRTLFGSFGLNTETARAAGGFKRLFYSLEGSHIGQTGYRQHSQQDVNRFNGRVDVELGRGTELSLFGKVGDMESQLPGNLTQRQVDTNPTQASAQFLSFNAQSNITRFQGAARITHTFGAEQSISATYYSRSLDYQLPTPNIFIEGLRKEQGGGLKYMSNRHLGRVENVFEAGADFQFQNEVRTDFNNIAGVAGTQLRRNETRYVGNQSYFAYDRVHVTRKLDLLGSVDYSHLKFTINNHLLNPVVSAGPQFDRVSFQAGAAYHFASRLSAYANVSTGFEPPTVTELGRDPTGGSGLNLRLKPQNSVSYEGGFFARPLPKIYLTAAVYRVNVTDEIVPTGIGFPQVSYTNAAKTIHNGVEVSLDVVPVTGLEFRSAYTYSNAYFDRFVNLVATFSGNRLPAIPRSRLFTTLSYRHRTGLFGAFENYYVSRVFVNDANSALNRQYDTSSAYAGYRKRLERVSFSLMFRVDNLTARRYSDYVVVDDQFGSYYYPAAPRNYSGVISIGLHLPPFFK